MVFGVEVGVVAAHRAAVELVVFDDVRPRRRAAYPWVRCGFDGDLLRGRVVALQVGGDPVDTHERFADLPDAVRRVGLQLGVAVAPPDLRLLGGLGAEHDAGAVQVPDVERHHVVGGPLGGGQHADAERPAEAEDAPRAPAAPAAEDLTVTVPTWGNATCPIMGKPSSEALYVDVKFGRIYICCPPCARKIRAEPAVAYRAAYPTATRIDNKVDPVTGSALGEKTVTMELQGYEFKVCADGCEAKAREHSQVTLVHLAARPRRVSTAK